jgi:hypothetical protein
MVGPPVPSELKSANNSRIQHRLLKLKVYSPKFATNPVGYL